MANGESNGSGAAKRIWDLASKIVGTLMVLSIGWTAGAVIELRTDLASIQANRMTAVEIKAELANLRESVAGIPRKNPPEWFKQEVDELKRELKDISLAVERMKTLLGQRNER